MQAGRVQSGSLVEPWDDGNLLHSTYSTVCVGGQGCLPSYRGMNPHHGAETQTFPQITYEAQVQLWVCDKCWGLTPPGPQGIVKNMYPVQLGSDPLLVTLKSLYTMQ